jgi:hypothetical protein
VHEQPTFLDIFDDDVIHLGVIRNDVLDIKIFATDGALTLEIFRSQK